MADAIFFLALITLDRLTKVLVERLMTLGQSIPLIPDFFHLTFVHNTGGAFGILAAWDSPLRRAFFVLASLAAMLLLGWLYRQARKGPSRPLRLSLILIGAGAVGNLYDRLVTGKVVDFLDFFVGSWHWPAFNLADSAITVGALTLAWLYLTNRAPVSPGA